MKKNKLTKLSQKISNSKVFEKLPAPDVLAFFKNMLEAYKEGEISRREIAKIEATKEILLTEIKERYTLYHKVFDLVFEERKHVIDKHFELIDKGVESNSNEVVLQGLEGLSKIVTKSPLADFDNFSKLLEGKQRIEL